MIQRIQSLWLFLASVVLFALFLFPYLQFADGSGLGHALKVSGAYGVVDGQPARLELHLVQLIVTVLLALFPLYIIFQFSNRKKQRSLILLEMLLVVLLGVWFYFQSDATLTQQGISYSIQYVGVGFFLLPVVLILLWMASSAIRKDEKLIRSADRLR